MIVVSNTSPVVNLATIGQLDLLRQLYGKVVIPKAVRDEIVVVGAGPPGANEIESLDWIETGQVTNQTSVASLRLELDQGESEAIVLAIEMNADLLLLDERKGRMIASRLGVRFIGLLAILVEAKSKGLILAVRPVMDDLIGKAGFWIGEKLYLRVLHAAGE